MGNKYLKKLFFVLVIAITCTINFNCHDVEEGGKEGWDYDKIVIDSSCSMYIEYAPKGKYLLNVSTMDTCAGLNNLKYLEGYKTLLERYSNKLVSNKGIITFQTSFILSSDTMFTNKLIDITNKKFNANSAIVKKEEFVLIIDTKPKY